MRPQFVMVAWPTATRDFPTVETTATYDDGEDSYDTRNVTLPSGIASGDLLVMFCNTVSAWSGGISVPSGWTALYTSVFSGESGDKVRCFYKTATGSEGSTVAVATPDWTRMSAVTFRISGWDSGEAPEAGTPAVNSGSTAPNPPSLTPSWGSDKTLWLAVSHSSAGSSVSYPTNYSGGVTAYSGVDNAYHARTAVAVRELEATSEDPGAFTLGSSATWVANTVAVLGALL